MRDVLRSEFKSLYHTFRHDAWRLLDPSDRGEWSLIFHMQHHGVPTPLLDWTESFACALFFAHETWKPTDDAAIFVLDPAALNARVAGISAQITLDDNLSGEARVKTNLWHPQFVPPDEDRPCLAVTPVRSNYRMLAQRGTFTLSGDSFESLDVQYQGIIRKIVLPAAIHSDVERFLNLVNVGVQGYFPDLQGLQRKYRARLEWHLREAERVRKGGAAG
jgi:hypothetical protein